MPILNLIKIYFLWWLWQSFQWQQNFLMCTDIIVLDTSRLELKLSKYKVCELSNSNCLYIPTFYNTCAITVNVSNIYIHCAILGLYCTCHTYSSEIQIRKLCITGSSKNRVYWRDAICVWYPCKPNYCHYYPYSVL